MCALMLRRYNNPELNLMFSMTLMTSYKVRMMRIENTSWY